jgi:hypothetical protein
LLALTVLDVSAAVADVELAAAVLLTVLRLEVAADRLDVALPVDAGDFACPVEEALCEEAPDPEEGPVSAEATAGIAKTAAPRPSVIADAPTQLAMRTWLDDPASDPASPPNSAGSARNQERRRLARCWSVSSELSAGFITI